LEGEFDQILAALADHGVRFVVVGGLAVGAWGYVRATRDVDVMLADGEENWSAAAVALRALEATRVDGSPLNFDLLDGGQTVRALTASGRVDLIPEGVAPIDLETAEDGARQANVDGRVVNVTSLPTLVAMKRLAGRPQDRLDLEALETAHGGLPDVQVPGLD
jgi:hypothetical protein